MAICPHNSGHPSYWGHNEPGHAGTVGAQGGGRRCEQREGVGEGEEEGNVPSESLVPSSISCGWEGRFLNLNYFTHIFNFNLMFTVYGGKVNTVRLITIIIIMVE